MRSFEWQEGYGAYIRNQTEHHRNRAFREEFRAMLRKHGLDYDERLLG
jgi:hypothetical protein